MQQIVNFIIRNKTFLLYLLLFTISIFFTIQSHSYHRSKFVSSANFLSGGLYNSANSISQYFNLKNKNNVLVEENIKLRSILHNSDKNSITDTISITQQYSLTSATVIKNSYSNTNNSLLIDRGEKDGIKQDLGVVSSKGLIGIIDNTSNSYSRVVSILNTNSRINAQLKKTNHFGTLLWNTESPQIVQLVDVPKIAPVTVGDTIITGGRSTIFPKGIEVGIVESFKLDAAEDFYELNINLFNDMTNIGHVYVIKNNDSEEIINLENTNE